MLPAEGDAALISAMTLTPSQEMARANAFASPAADARDAAARSAGG